VVHCIKLMWNKDESTNNRNSQSPSVQLVTNTECGMLASFFHIAIKVIRVRKLACRTLY
jgi:hypothetical protein